jgi:hypothetical protein
MELPTDVSFIIHEFSQPLTRCDWRRLHKMTNDQFVSLLFLAIQKNYVNPLLRRTFNKACDRITSIYMTTTTSCSCRKQHKICKCSASFCTTNYDNTN